MSFIGELAALAASFLFAMTALSFTHPWPDRAWRAGGSAAGGATCRDRSSKHTHGVYKKPYIFLLTFPHNLAVTKYTTG